MTRNLFLCAMVTAFASIFSAHSFGQDGPLLPPDGPGIPVDAPTAPGPPATPTTGNNQNFAGGGGTTATDSDDTVDIEDSATLNLGGSTVDTRNQGFVGATAPGLAERNFVGASSQTFGQLAEGATFGGGVNDSTQIQLPSGSAGGAGGAGGFRGAGGGLGGQNTGVIIRRNLRSRLRPAFAAPQVPAQVTVGRFNSNLSRQSGTRSLVGRYQVVVQNKTAYLTGSVSTRADADRLVRQLRLQPGVYRIVNQLVVQ